MRHSGQAAFKMLFLMEFHLSTFVMYMHSVDWTM